MKFLKVGLLGLVCLAFTQQSFAAALIPLPAQPKDPNHPGSAVYAFDSREETIQWNGRSITFFGSFRKDGRPYQAPVVVFGHGHAVPLLSYRATFEHMAKKGVAVIYPQYDTSWMDGDFHRMGYDYVALASYALQRYAKFVNPDQVVFAGHSNGAYAALVACAAVNDPHLTQWGVKPVHPKAAVLFETAGYIDEMLPKIDPEITITMVVGDQDTGTPPSLTAKIYNRLSVKRKQAILVRSYTMTSPQAIADHGFVRTFGWTGGRLNPLHYYGSWKFMIGAAWDLMTDHPFTNPYLYGELAGSTGIQGFEHTVHRGP